MKNKFKIFIAFLIINLSIIGTICAQLPTTVTLYPNIDALIHSYAPNNNYGSNAAFRAVAGTIGGVPYYQRSLIKFDLSSIPCDATINDANLYLYGTNHNPASGNNSVYFHRVTGSWAESTVTWNNQPTVSTRDQLSLATTTSSTQNDVLGLTSWVQNMILLPNINYGIMMRLQAENYYNDRYYASSDHSTTSLRPKLVITYSRSKVYAGIDQSMCANDSVQLSATNATIYSWSPTTGLSNANISNPIAKPISTTTYIVTGTKGDGCQTTDSVIVNVNPLPYVNVGSDVSICSGGSVQLNASGASTYSWNPSTGLSNPSIANPVASPGSTITYIVTGTNSIGCQNSDTMVVQVNSLPVVSAGPDVNICSGDSIQLNASGADTYSWSPSTGLSNPNIVNPFASPSSTTTYIVTGTINDIGCQSSDTIVVQVKPLPSVSAGPDVSICSGDSVQLNASGALTYSWSPTTGLSDPNIANPIANPASTITYTVIGTKLNGCQNTDSVVVTVNGLPYIYVNNGNLIICEGDSTQLYANAEPLNGPHTYSWSPITGLSDPNIFNPIASPAVTTTYTVTGTDSNGCQNTDVVFVQVNPALIIDAGTDKTICYGDSVQLNASGAQTYSWSPSTGLSNPNIANPIASPASTITYIVTGTEGNCQNMDTVVVQVNPIPIVDAGIDQTICEGDSVQLNASGATIYSWDPPNGLSNPNISNPVASPTAFTTYIVTGITNGCESFDGLDIFVLPKPVFNINADAVEICTDDSVTLSIGVATSSCSRCPATAPFIDITWSPINSLNVSTGTSVIATPNITTTYVVSVTDANGCVSYDSITIFVTPCIGSPIIGCCFNNYGAEVHINEFTFLNIHCNLLNETGGIVNGAIQEGLFQNQGVIRVEKDWINNANSNLFMTYEGNSELFGGYQRLRGRKPTHFYNLELSGTNKKELFVDQYLFKHLNLNDNELATTDKIFYIENLDAAIISRNTGFVSTDGIGYLSRRTHSSGKYLFPMGSSQ
ncbi:MAG: DNRLRE domain-containing protein, partial [Bacteroidota bacterium]|nr:DNRLRE domain-containing protein [Bacteroidota bacterium]